MIIQEDVCHRNKPHDVSLARASQTQSDKKEKHAKVITQYHDFIYLQRAIRRANGVLSEGEFRGKSSGVRLEMLQRIVEEHPNVNKDVSVGYDPKRKLYFLLHKGEEYCPMKHLQKHLPFSRDEHYRAMFKVP